MKKFYAPICLFLLIGLISNGALAQSNTLDAIRQRGKVIVGVLFDAPPFGMLDEKMQPTGYDVDVARILAKDLSVEIEFVQTTVPNRIPYLQSGRVDLIMAAFSVTPERALSVAFSTPYGILNQVVMGAKDVQVANAADLAGKRIAVVRGALQDTAVTRVAPAGTQIQRYDDDGTVAAALASGQNELAGMAEATAHAVMAKSTSRPLEIKFLLMESPFSVGIRKGDTELLRWVNTWIYYHRRVSRQFDSLHVKYFGSGIPADLGYF